MKRGDFICRTVGVLVGLPLLGLKNPPKVTDADGDYRHPWPNVAPFPCNSLAIDPPQECGLCRAGHNRTIRKWDLENWEQLEINPVTGMWKWGGDSSSFMDAFNDVLCSR